MRRSNVKRARSAEAVGSVLAAAVPAPPTRDSRVLSRRDFHRVSDCGASVRG